MTESRKESEGEKIIDKEHEIDRILQNALDTYMNTSNKYRST